MISYLLMLPNQDLNANVKCVDQQIPIHEKKQLPSASHRYTNTVYVSYHRKNKKKHHQVFCQKRLTGCQILSVDNYLQELSVH